LSVAHSYEVIGVGSWREPFFCCEVKAFLQRELFGVAQRCRNNNRIFHNFQFWKTKTHQLYCQQKFVDLSFLRKQFEKVRMTMGFDLTWFTVEV
jgi:hypothetical protein